MVDQIVIRTGQDALCPTCNKMRWIKAITFTVTETTAFVRLSCEHQLVFETF